MCLASLEAPANGSITGNYKGYYEFEDVIIFDCDPGYSLVGDGTITCRRNGTRTNTAPKCESEKYT